MSEIYKVEKYVTGPKTDPTTRIEMWQAGNDLYMDGWHDGYREGYDDAERELTE